MDYSTAEQIRKRGFSASLTSRLLSGAPIGQSIRETISESMQAKATGIKQKFDPLNIVKALTGGSNIAPAILGRMMGRSDENIGFFTNKKRKKDPNYTSIGEGPPKKLRIDDTKADILAKMYNFMHQDIDMKEKRLKDEKKYRKELDAAKERRMEEVVAAFYGRDIRQKEKVTQKPSVLKFGVLGAIGLGGMLFSEEAFAMIEKFDIKNMIPDFTGFSPSTTEGPVPTNILDLIGKYESGGDYNKLVGGKTAPLTTMTVGEVLKYQGGMKARGHESTAVGKYQIIKGTLESLIKEGVVKETDVFSPETQDKLAKALLNRRGYQDYLSGKITKSQFIDQVAKEWAAIATSSGESAYKGIGTNKAAAGAREQLSRLLDTAPEQMPLASAPVAPMPLPQTKTLPTPIPKAQYGVQESTSLLNNTTNVFNGGTTYQYTMDNSSKNSVMMDKQYGYN